jgi:hypothetical protein
MNMISTGAFQTEMDATSKLIKAWESKNKKNAAKAGGISLMALSLAACGSDSTTTTATDSTTTTVTTVAAVSANFTTAVDSLTGSTAADTFTGDANVTSAADSVDGGSGSDTLKMYGTADLPNMTSIENLEIHNITPGNVDLSSTSLTQVTSLTVDGFTAAGQTITTKAGDTVSLSDVTGAAADINIASAAAVTSVDLSVDGSGDATNAIDFQVAGTGITTINIGSSGAASFIDVDTVAATTKVDINAAAALTIENIEVAKTIDASDSTAAVTINAVGAADAAVTLGSGDDSVAVTLSAKDVLDGGAGTDTLVISASALTASGASITGFEVLELAESGGTAVNVDGDVLAYTEYTVSGTNFSTATLSDMVTGNTYNVKIADATVNATDTITINHKVDGTADSITLNVGSTTGVVNIEDIIADDPETVNINLIQKTDDTDHDIENMTFTDATSVVVTGAGDAAIAGINLKDAAHTFDASAATGDLTLTFEDSQDQTIKTGAGKDGVTLASGSLDGNDVIDLGDGADTLTAAGLTALPSYLDVANTETINLTIANDAAATAMDVRNSASLTTLKIIAAGTSMDQNMTISGLSDSVAITLQDIIPAAGDTHTFNAVSGATTMAFTMDQYGAADATSHNLTVDSSITTLSFSTDDEDMNVSTLTAAGATALTLTVGADGKAIDIDSLTTAALTSLVITNGGGTTDYGVTIDAATTANVLTTITTSGLDQGTDGKGDVVLGSAANIVDRSDTATITMGRGDDSLSFNIGQHGGNAIDMGAGDDTLLVGGTQTGDFAINLTLTTDQISSVNGVANAAVQVGITNIDASSVTVSAGKFTITDTTGDDTIKTSSGADQITLTGGTDTVQTNAGADTVILADSDGVLNLGSDTAADKVIFDAITDGGHTAVTITHTTSTANDFTATAGTTILSVTNFTSGTDKIEITGALKTALNGTNDGTNGADSTAVDLGNNTVIDGDAGTVFIAHTSDDLTGDDFGDMSALIVAYNTTNSGTPTRMTASQEILFAVGNNSGTQMGLYHIMQNDEDDIATADVITLLGIFTVADLAAADFVL